MIQPSIPPPSLSKEGDNHNIVVDPATGARNKIQSNSPLKQTDSLKPLQSDSLSSKSEQVSGLSNQGEIA